MEMIEKRILELEIRINRYIYFKSKSQLKILESVQNEDFESAAEERDHIALFDQKIEETQIKIVELTKSKK
jgi:protein-arginine kinase activator protein McsA